MELFRLVGTVALSTANIMSELDNISKKAGSMADSFKSAGDKISGIGKTMTTVFTTVGLSMGGIAIKTAASFESAMSEVAAISGATGDDLKALTEKAKYMGETTKFSASEAAEGLKYMAMAGWETEDMLNGLEGIMMLAASSGEDLGLTSDIVTDALTAFGLSAKDSGHFADILAQSSSSANTNVSLLGESFKYVAPVAGALGMSAEDTALALGLMANSGIKGSEAGTALRSALTNLVKPTDAMSVQMEKLGIEVINADGSMKSLDDIMLLLRSTFSNLTEAQQAEAAATMFGKEAMSGMLAIINASEGDYNKLRDAISDCNGVAQEQADIMNDNLNGQLTLLKSQLEGLAIQFVTLIMPYLKEGVEWLSKLLTWISNLDDGTKKMIITIGAILTAAGPILIFVGKVVSGIGSIISIGSSLIGGFAKLTGGIGSIISVGSKVVGGIGTVVAKVGGVLIPAIASVGAPVLIVIGVITALIAIGVLLYKNWDEIKEFGQKTWDAITGFLKDAAEKIGGFFTGLFDWFKDNWQGVLLFIVNPIAGAFKLLYDNCEAFREFIDGFLDKVKNLFSNFGKGISDGFHNLKDNVTAKATELKDNVVNKFTELKDRGGEKFNELKDNATAKITELKDNAVSRFTSLKDDALNKTEELKEGASQKFSELKDNATAKITELKDSAVNKFTELKDKGSEKFNELKESATQKIDELKEKGLTRFNEFRDGASSAVDSLKEAASNKFSELKDNALSKFGEIGSGIVSAMQSARDKVSEVIDKVKSFFDFDWSLPKIPLPHFNIEGSFSLNPPSIPSFDVEWYAGGGVMTKPTAFGYNPFTGRTMVGGEAGAEAIAPISILMEYIRAAVAESNAGLMEIMTKIYILLVQMLPELANAQVVMDTGQTVGALALPLSDALGQLVLDKERGVR